MFGEFIGRMLLRSSATLLRSTRSFILRKDVKMSKPMQFELQLDKLGFYHCPKCDTFIISEFAEDHICPSCLDSVMGKIARKRVKIVIMEEEND